MGLLESSQSAKFAPIFQLSTTFLAISLLTFLKSQLIPFPQFFILFFFKISSLRVVVPQPL